MILLISRSRFDALPQHYQGLGILLAASQNTKWFIVLQFACLTFSHYTCVFFTESLQVLEHIFFFFLEIFDFLKRPRDAALHYLVHNGDLMAPILMQFNSSRL
jgi:hypothetical protein